MKEAKKEVTGRVNSNSKPARRKRRAVAAALLAEFFSERGDIPLMASRNGLTLHRLAMWARKPQNARMIEAVIQLAERRADLSVARARADAAFALRRLATSRETGTDAIACKAGGELLRIARRAPLEEAVEVVEVEEVVDPDAVRAQMEAEALKSPAWDAKEGES